MEACIVICRTVKPKERRKKILLINAVEEVTRERAQSFLTNEHIQKIVRAYEAFQDEPGFAKVATVEEIRAKDGNLSIPLFVTPLQTETANVSHTDAPPIADALTAWIESGHSVSEALEKILPDMKRKPLTVLASGNMGIPLFDRKGWRKLSFGEFAQNVNERVEPADAADEIYVGLDDLDSQSLHIRRWGKGSDVIGTKLRFCKGDIIFGRRRAYQRKLAVAEFDGICSAHAMVVRAKSKVVLPEFLPFLMMSDKFMNRAVEISVGSLSPTINWTTLKLEEFALPPLDQQRRIAEILWAVDEVGACLVKLYWRHQELYQSQIQNLLFNHRKGKITQIKEITAINQKALPEKNTSPDFEFFYVDISSIIAPKKLGTLEKIKFADAPSRARRCVKTGDILVSTVRPNLQAFVRLSDREEQTLIASTGFAVITPQTTVWGGLVYHSFFSQNFLTYCESKVTGTNYPAIKSKDIGEFTIRLPDEKQQEYAKDVLDQMDICREKIEQELDNVKSLKKSLIEQLLSQFPTGQAQ